MPVLVRDQHHKRASVPVVRDFREAQPRGFLVIPAGEKWGPFAEGIDPAEQRARLRSLRALAKVYAGPRAAEACRLLARAETDPTALELASMALNRLAPTDRRNVLASYARLSSIA